LGSSTRAGSCWQMKWVWGRLFRYSHLPRIAMVPKFVTGGRTTWFWISHVVELAQYKACFGAEHE